MIFAVDSIPAIFAVTSDPYIVFTSNVFAILGLRSLYFLLASYVEKFTYLKPSLAFVLMFVGGKMALIDVVKIHAAVSLLVVLSILAVGIVASVIKQQARRRRLGSSRGGGFPRGPAGAQGDAVSAFPGSGGNGGADPLPAPEERRRADARQRATGFIGRKNLDPLQGHPVETDHREGDHLAFDGLDLPDEQVLRTAKAPDRSHPRCRRHEMSLPDVKASRK